MNKWLTGLLAFVAAWGFLPTAASENDWRSEVWTVEPFTHALGGGPQWGPLGCVGQSMRYMVQDKDGSHFIVAAAQRVDIVTPDGMRYVLAGTGVPGFRDGPAAEAQFRMGENAYYGFCNITADDLGNVFVGDSGNDRVRRIFKDAAGKWTVETYAGGGEKKLDAGQTCVPCEARLGSSIHVAAAPDGRVYVATTYCAYMIEPGGRSIKGLGPWPKSIAKPGKPVKFNGCGGGCDRNGVAYFGARTTDVACRITSDGRIEHFAGATIIKSDPESRQIGDRAPPILANFDTPSSFFVDWSGKCTYMCGGDEYDVRRVPTDMKTTTATLLQNGRWYVFDKHPNGNRSGKGPLFDSSLEGKPNMEGGNVYNLTVSPLVGIDREGNLYGKLNHWSGPTVYVADKGYLPTHIFKIRRVK